MRWHTTTRARRSWVWRTPYREFLLRYGFAVFCTAAATLLRMGLTPHIGDRIPFGTYFLSVILVAWLVGAKPAVLALLLSTVAAGHFVIPPEGSLLITSTTDQISLVVFFVVGSISIGLFYRLGRQNAIAQRHAEEKSELTEKLIAADLRKNQFLALLSHELRSPLAPMRYASDLLQQVSNDPAKVRQTALLLDRSLVHLRRLVDDLLDVSRYLQGNINLKPERIDLRDCVSLAIDMNQGQLEAKQHRLYVNVPANPVWIQADSVRCCQIVCNLLSNAAKYTPQQGKIQVTLQMDARGAETVVEDNGIGLHPSMREQIFEPFFQAHSKASRFSAGMGLGLTIAQKLAELHGGRIEVESRGLGTGSRFVFWMPAQAPSDTPVSLPSSTLPGTATNHARASRNDSPRVLIVDDDTDTTSALCQLLQLEGFQTRIAHDGLTALNELREFLPHFVLLDIGLPGIDGYEIAKRMRRGPYGKNVVIIAVSGWGSAVHRQLGLEAGFQAHLVKPVALADLRPHLRLHNETREDHAEQGSFCEPSA